MYGGRIINNDGDWIYHQNYAYAKVIPVVNTNQKTTIIISIGTQKVLHPLVFG